MEEIWCLTIDMVQYFHVRTYEYADLLSDASTSVGYLSVV